MDKRDKETYNILGAAMEVHRILGCGFLEAVYQEALYDEFQKRRIPCIEQPELRITYKGQILRHCYRLDFLCYDSVAVEIKALSALTSNEHAQMLNYLKAGNLNKGLLINFGARSLQFKRFIRTLPSREENPTSAESVKSVDEQR